MSDSRRSYTGNGGGYVVTATRVVTTVALGALIGCAGRSAGIEGPTGGSSPEKAVEAFLVASQEAVRAQRAGEVTQADRAYERMAAVFGTESGSISRAYPADEVRSRMIVLSSCLRPDNFRVTSGPDPRALASGRTTVTVELQRGTDTMTIPFRLVRGRDDRWFIEQIDLASTFSC